MTPETRNWACSPFPHPLSPGTAPPRSDVASGRVDGLLVVGVRRAAMSSQTLCSVVQPLAVGRTPEQLRLLWITQSEKCPRRRVSIWSWAAASGVLDCSHRRTYEMAGHRWRRPDTGPLQPSIGLLTRYRYLRGPGSPSSSQSPRRRSRLLRRTGSSGELACSGARHLQDSMWRRLLVTEPLVADIWSLLVAYSRL